MNLSILRILENAVHASEGSIVNQVIRRVINGEAKPAEIKFVMDAMDRAGNGNGTFEMNDFIEVAVGTVESGCDVVAEVVCGILDVLGNLF